MNMNHEIERLEIQLRQFQSELNSLKQYVHNKEASTTEQNNEREGNAAFSDISSIKGRTTESKSSKETTDSALHQESRSSFSTDHQKVSTESEQISSSANLERIFGKYFMGIAASILIFIGLILFGILVYQNFTDTLKMLFIYGISAALLLAGILFLRKKRNTFFLSLTGCGLGSFYTSLILTYTYFHVINDITLYGLLFIWALAVIFIARQYHAVVITVIGQIGILIASLFGLSVIHSNTDFFLLSIFILFSTSLFVLLQRKDERKAIHYFLLLTDSFLVLAVGLYRFFEEESSMLILGNTAAVLFLLYGFALFLYFIVKHLKDETDSVLVFSFLTLLLILATVELVFSLQTAGLFHAESKAIMLVLWFFVWWITGSFLKLKDQAKIVAFILLYLVMMVLYQVYIPSIYCLFSFSLFFLPFLLIGYWKKDRLYKTGGFAILGLQLIYFLDLPKHFIPILVITGITLLLTALFISLDIEQYKMKMKVFHYFYVISYIIFTCIKLYYSSYTEGLHNMILPILAFFTTSILTIVMLRFGWCQNFNTGEAEPGMKSLLTKMLQLYLLYGIKLCYSDHIHFLIHVLLILWLTVLCLYGFKDFLKAKGIQTGSVILAVKYTAYILFILHSFTFHIQTLTSIICLLIAIVCILTGFRLEAKYLRIYGLTLTMLAVAKLLLFDISYTDSIGRIVSFFTCGILCFLINFIYSFVVKKYEK